MEKIDDFLKVQMRIADLFERFCDRSDAFFDSLYEIFDKPASGPHIKTALNTDFNPDRGEFNTAPSDFIPGQAMSVSELAARLRTGQLPMIAKDPEYSEEEDLDEDLTFEDPVFDLTDFSDRLASIDYAQTVESSEHRQSYDGDGAAAPKMPQAPIDVDNSSAGSSELNPS